MQSPATQHLIIGIDGTSVDDRVREVLARFRPAGVILFARNLGARDAGTTDLRQVRRLTDGLQVEAEALGIGPLLIGIDHEGGRIVRMGPPVTRFPGNAALAATGSLELARRQARAMADELLAMGINWDFAPCVDVNSNPRNPVIGPRSFGDTPEVVSAFGNAMIEAFQGSGLIACAKHFPGHGDTEVDSHIGLPVVSRLLESLREVELPPFRAAIAAGVASIMTAHIVFAALDPDRPATASRRIITGLLREELGYSGVVVTDAIDMAGFQTSVGVENGVVDCINAGVDLILACNSLELQERALRALEDGQAEGRLDGAAGTRARERVATLKERFLHPQRDVPLSVVGCAEHRELEREIAEKCRT